MIKYSVKRIVGYALFLFFLLNFNVAMSSDMCGFNGLVPDPQQWQDEFSIFLEDEGTPGYLIMVRVIGAIAVTPATILKNPLCEVSKYVEALMTYYQNNENSINNKHNNIAEGLRFIRTKVKKADGEESK